MGHISNYHTSWDTVYDYLDDPGNAKKHGLFYSEVESIIKYWLLHVGLKTNLDGHAKSIFSDLYLKERKRYEAGKLIPEKCTAQITTYYYPVIKNLCLDYINIMSCKMPFTEDICLVERPAEPGVFDTLWGEHKNTVLTEMSRGVQDFIELSNYAPNKKKYLKQRYIDGKKFPDIFIGIDKTEFETQRKWICRQGKKIASKIAQQLLPAIIEYYKLPISKKVDPKIIEKYLLGLRAKLTT